MEIPRHWRLKKQRYALIGEVCPHCDAKLFPPRDICPHCGGRLEAAGAQSADDEATPRQAHAGSVRLPGRRGRWSRA